MEIKRYKTQIGIGIITTFTRIGYVIIGACLSVCPSETSLSTLSSLRVTIGNFVLLRTPNSQHVLKAFIVSQMCLPVIF